MGAATTTVVDPSTTGGHGYSIGVHDQTCARCGGRVYANEMIRTEARNAQSDGHCWHQTCFKCKDCGTKLRPDTWEEASNGDLLCKTHYIARKNSAELS